MRKYMLVLLASLAVLAMSASDDLRIMSYNVRNARGLDNVRDVDRTAGVINKVAPDVVAVQELDSVTRRSGGTYVLGELAARTGMYATYAPAIDFNGGKYGVGILSKQKPLNIYARQLPGREESRVLVVAEFDKYALCCTHLSLTEADRMASIGIMNEIAKSVDKPLFVAGDMNATPDSPFIQSLMDSFTILNDTTKMTFPADKPDETIDYIVEYKQPVPTFVTRVRDRRVIDEPMASDHRPIVVDVTITKADD